MDSSSIQKSQDLFKERVLKYYKQLEQGCGFLHCENLFCRSCPGTKKFNLSSKEVGLLSMKLAMLPNQAFLCGDAPKAVTTPEIITLDLNLIESYIIEYENTKKNTNLVRLIGSTFGNADSLAFSFLKSPINTAFDGTDTGLDFEKLKKFYNLLSNKEWSDHIFEVMAGACGRLCGDLTRYGYKDNKLALARIFLIILSNPQLLINTNFQKFTGVFFELISNSKESPSFQPFLIQYFARFDEETFICQLHQFHDFIAQKILEGDESYVVNSDKGVRGAARLLDIMHKLNKVKGWCSEEVWYNQILNDNLDLRIDFISWKASDPRFGIPLSEQKNRFSFCNYPWILTAEIKNKVLSIESSVEQRRMHQESFQLLAQGLIDMPYLRIDIRRDFLMEDSIDTIMAVRLTNPESLKKQLRVVFANEEGVDAGGVQKEWLQLLVAELFSPKYGMFTPNEEAQTYWFNHKSQDLIQYELLGCVIGLAIYNGVILDLKFPSIVYKKLLLQNNYTIEDLKDVSPAIYNGLKQLMDYKGKNLEEDFDLDFQITYDYYETKETFDLVPQGSNIPVTEANKDEYIRLYLEYLLKNSVEIQINAFVRGFKAVCNSQSFDLFTPTELQLIVCGSPDLDFHELEKGATYENGFTKDDPTIKWLLEIVHDYSLEQKKKLLFFTTGSDRAPIGGLGKMEFIIMKHGDDGDRLPTAHTCFNHLLLPPYSTKEKCKKMLENAINNATGFGLL